MIEERLIREIAREMAEVTLAPASARATAEEAAAMMEALRAERGRLRLEHGPRELERLLRCSEPGDG